MKRIKVCSCGKIYYEDENEFFPDICEQCGSFLIDIESIDEIDNDNISINKSVQKNKKISNGFYLINSDLNISIPIIKDCIIGRGRNSVGHEQLQFNSVSREHIKIKIINKFSIEIEDVSKFGTKINGKKLVKGVPTKMSIGDTLSLYEYDVKLERK